MGFKHKDSSNMITRKTGLGLLGIGSPIRVGNKSKLWDSFPLLEKILKQHFEAFILSRLYIISLLNFQDKI